MVPYPLPAHRDACRPAPGDKHLYALVAGRRWHLGAGRMVSLWLMVKTRSRDSQP